MTLNQSRETSTLPEAPIPSQMLYPKPLILLLDMPPGIAQTLQETGFNIIQGSFGTQYSSTNDSSPVFNTAYMPEQTSESEIVIIDLSTNIAADVDASPFRALDGTPFYVDTPLGVADPRPLAMEMAKANFDRILEHGGIFVMFVEDEEFWTFSRLEDHTLRYHIKFSTWGFLSDLGSIASRRDVGKEIKLVSEDSLIGQTLNTYLHGARFKCILSFPNPDNHLVLATNKYDQPVAAILVPIGKHPGAIFIVPQLVHKSSFLVQFLKDFLPVTRPDLFPYFESRSWATRPEYEIPDILKIKKEIQQIEDEANRRRDDLQQQITEKREAYGYLHALLTETDDSLVSAVEKALAVLGFQNVINADKAFGERKGKREDLQILDADEWVLAEVKGVQGTPKESDCLQVLTYLAGRQRELNKTNLRCLTIVNHGRHLPPLERNPAPFTADVLQTALSNRLGLLTTWNLQRLVRNFLKLGWTYSQIAPLFYQAGVIEPIPAHYEFVGIVDHYYPAPAAVTVNVECGQINLGDRIAYELPVEFEEQTVNSLQIDREPVTTVPTGQLAGIKTELSRDQLRHGVKVYRVKVANRG